MNKYYNYVIGNSEAIIDCVDDLFQYGVFDDHYCKSLLTTFTDIRVSTMICL